MTRTCPTDSLQLCGASPWGTFLEVEAVQPGVTFVVMGRHGGYHLTPAVNVAIPASVRCEDGWHERDVAAALCARFVPFPDADLAYGALVRDSATRTQTSTRRRWKTRRAPYSDRMHASFAQRLCLTFTLTGAGSALGCLLG
ncbi:hypothetical protein GO986_17205 [Deinococcus sp. HMF7620]|uniref:DUF7007 domain-containing protein n=1 Tax=Deinococcus arboris TaxID=2682977 RepID=A0A7C9M3T0_9DEIO|nr:hypothetical protein [Deinococcus arboris]MVN88482.1 hypothetical protein [Deinococcus arboris]